MTKKNPFAEKVSQWARDKKKEALSTKRKLVKVPPRKLNEALGEIALNRIGYQQGSTPVEIDPAAQAAADCVLSGMNCPLSKNRDWDCNKVREGEELGHPIFDKGGESQCKNGGFVTCPAYHRYFNWRMEHQAKKRDKE